MKISKRAINEKFKHSFQKVSELSGSGLSSIESQYQRLLDQRITLGVTGLSQSGKSTFITSLINQLSEFDRASLAGFSPVLSDRLSWVKLHPLDEKDLPEFPYRQNYQWLASPNPRWPDSTQDVSGCLLELRLKRAKNKLNPFAIKEFSLFLEIRDYPGEWLLDLPLRDMTFSRWCAQCNAQYSQDPRAQIMGNLLGELQSLDPLAPVDKSYLDELNKRYCDFLKACKYSDKSLSLIQPGRFLIPGNSDAADQLCFVPLLKCGSYTEGQLNGAAEDSYFKVCERRYKSYVKELVEPFYRDFFSRIDRQLILVDVVKALNSGPEYVDDMRQALANITDSFAYGSRSRLLQLFRSKIDKVIFAATKVDQIVSEDHEAAKQLLSVIIKQAYNNAQHEGVKPICEATAAVRSSKEIEHQAEKGLSGADSNGEPIGYTHLKIPERIPTGDQWEPFLCWEIPQFNPPKGLSFTNSDAIPHIRMDTVINELIGDKCE